MKTMEDPLGSMTAGANEAKGGRRAGSADGGATRRSGAGGGLSGQLSVR